MRGCERRMLHADFLESVRAAAAAAAAREALPWWRMVRRWRLKRAVRAHLIDANRDARLLLEEVERRHGLARA
jgi:hypothetical protein